MKFQKEFTFTHEFAYTGLRGACLHKETMFISFSVRGNDNSLSGNNFSLSDNDISLSDNALSQSVNDISLCGNEISLTGNEISQTTRRNLATTGTKDVPKYRAIFRSKQNVVKIRRAITIFAIFVDYRFYYFCPIL